MESLRQRQFVRRWDISVLAVDHDLVRFRINFDLWKVRIELHVPLADVSALEDPLRPLLEAVAGNVPCLTR